MSINSDFLISKISAARPWDMVWFKICGCNERAFLIISFSRFIDFTLKSFLYFFKNTLSNFHQQRISEVCLFLITACVPFISISNNGYFSFVFYIKCFVCVVSLTFYIGVAIYYFCLETRKL